MAKYTVDGGVIPSGLGVSERKPKGGKESLLGLYKGIVFKVVYPEDQQNITKERIEYVVKVKGQLYPNAVDLRRSGGIYNYQERVLKEVERSESGKIDQSVFDNLLDGEFVYVMFLEGNGDIPIIIGSAEHPQKAKYKKSKKSDGRYSVEEFNGVEIKIDKDSNMTIKHVGRKDPGGKILNQAALDSQIKMFGNGDIEINTHGTQGSADLRAKFTKADKKIEIYAQENKIVAGADGIKLTDKFGSFIELKSGAVQDDVVGNKIENASGNKTETIGGNWNINITGNVTITTPQADINADVLNLGTGASEKAVLGDQLKAYLDSHIHPTGVGPSGPPTTPMNALSSTVKVAT
jgi:hypothetical protein